MSERVILFLSSVDAAITTIRAAQAQEKVIVVDREEEKRVAAQKVLLTAATLGVSLPLPNKSALKNCSRCQRPFVHKGAYCSKECFYASNGK